MTYSFYPVFAQLYGLGYREVPLNDDFSLPLEPFLGGNGGVVIANPNAPTGQAVGLDAIRALLEGNPQSVVLVDEAYVDFGAASAVELVKAYPNLVVVQTMSKSRAPGGPAGGVCPGGREPDRRPPQREELLQLLHPGPAGPGRGGGALSEPDYLRQTAEKIIATRARTTAALRAMGFQVADSAANFLFVSHPAAAAKTLLDGLRARGILVRWWDRPRISNHLRITVGTDGEMDALLSALEELVP